MPRSPIIYTDEHPYHIRARSNNRDWYDLPLDTCFKIYSDILATTIERYRFELHAFTLMNNHFHLMTSTPEKNISAGMQYFMTQTAKEIRDSACRINHVYGGRHKSSVITTEIYYANCFKYVYRNPVRAGIVTRVEEYPWSTISQINHPLKDLVVPPSNGHGLLIESLNGGLLPWLNTPTPKELEEATKRALTKGTFEFTPNRKTQKICDPYGDLPLRIHKRC
jgi:putative transposase